MLQLQHRENLQWTVIKVRLMHFRTLRCDSFMHDEFIRETRNSRLNVYLNVTRIAAAKNCFVFFWNSWLCVFKILHISLIVSLLIIDLIFMSFVTSQTFIMKQQAQKSNYSFAYKTIIMRNVRCFFKTSLTLQKTACNVTRIYNIVSDSTYLMCSSFRKAYLNNVIL